MANELVIARDFFAHESITVSSTAVGLTTGTIQPGTRATPAPHAQFAQLTVETDQIRVTYDGTTPTSTVGHLVNAGDIIELHGINNLRRFLMIRVTGDATVKGSYAR